MRDRMVPFVPVHVDHHAIACADAGTVTTLAACHGAMCQLARVAAPGAEGTPADEDNSEDRYERWRTGAGSLATGVDPGLGELLGWQRPDHVPASVSSLACR